MAILNELDKKITQIGKATAKKTKAMTESARLAGEISEEERKIKQCYAQIGRQFVAGIAPDSVAEEYQELYNCALASEKRIEELSVPKVTGSVMNCPTCQTPIPEDSIFCNSCGAKLDSLESNTPQPIQTPAPKEGAVCAGCGNPLSDGQIFCINCGTRVEMPPTDEPDDADMTELVEKEELGEEVIDEKRQRQCPECGVEVSDGQVFCISCGKKLQ